MIKLGSGCALISTKGKNELHKFARKAGFDRKLYIKPLGPGASGCYFLRTKKLQRKALSLGAVAW